jgi:lipid-A-disaccharide synthase
MASVRILISAGEASGEMYGALLMDALQRLAGESPATTRNQKLEFFGVGGDRMRAAGCDMWSIPRSSVVGISEILSHLPKIWACFTD